MYMYLCAFYKSRASPSALFHKALLLSVVNVSPRKLVMLHHFKTYVIVISCGQSLLVYFVEGIFLIV